MTTHRPSVRRAPLALTALLLACPLAACGNDSAGGAGSETSELTVLAASSLTDAFEELATEFEASHDGTTVTFSFGSSTDLAEQVADGAPGDVLTTADETSMQLAEDAGVTGDISSFATNVLTIVTPADNPAGIESLDDLEGSTWVRCTNEAPCGKVAAAVLADNDITAEPASLEEDVRATLDKVVSGEADAGLVYATDAVAAEDAVVAVEIPGAESALTSYYTTVLEQSADAELAGEWVEFVASDEGLAILERAGFGKP
ncbi:molybdate ABC transporter substrate-binding protein [Nocardioides sp.]|uniref:molybdate ABC transporter substrate-binding protein n=1 Tax=Nocardioides sp. TaxID=35761 RepID=UPI002CF1BBC0|nr:molybdate ABC transporter substrate-binding protein [Nocardioides sp.]HXH77623.1 molybdate ABC transporter substrate-binding protein [Nocardioides sp.]